MCHSHNQPTAKSGLVTRLLTTERLVGICLASFVMVVLLTGSRTFAVGVKKLERNDSEIAERGTPLRPECRTAIASGHVAVYPPER